MFIELGLFCGSHLFECGDVDVRLYGLRSERLLCDVSERASRQRFGRVQSRLYVYGFIVLCEWNKWVFGLFGGRQRVLFLFGLPERVLSGRLELFDVFG